MEIIPSDGGVRPIAGLVPLPLDMQSPMSDAPPTLTFEAALQELQAIAERLEAGEQGLESSLKDFEAGVGLLRTCYGLLASAEQQIEQLVGLDAEGRPKTTAFDAPATWSAVRDEADAEA